MRRQSKKRRIKPRFPSSGKSTDPQASDPEPSRRERFDQGYKLIPAAALIAIAVLFIAEVVVGFIDFYHYAHYLADEGFGFWDIFVPWDVWWTYQSTGIGLIFNCITGGIWIVILLLGVFLFFQYPRIPRAER